ncbi:hypothetical protein [Arthrobacter sp. SLBN-112]|uniref:hypothetical protein n=1 Tax=Arthrobacter sp. SLBN-112 TaxID=2768452 RepID=UPI001F44C685|nr:hypothetical protein [Arthrobacter sp. SLBN-112]
MCDQHGAAIQQGEQWMLGGSMGVDDANGIPGAGTGFTILMADNLPPRYQSMGYQLVDGSQPGYLMKFDVAGPAGPDKYEFFVPKDEFASFPSFFAS